MLKFLFGMLAGYLVCTFEFAIMLVKKGYTSVKEIQDKHTKNN
jgi:hypothetical protein